jgi:hypothetical protein
VIANYNATQANTPTPAGQVLLQNGIFNANQLQQLQGVQQPIYNGSSQLFPNPMFKSIDASVSYPIRLKWLGEGRSLEPAVQMYNVANFANWGGFSTAGGALVNTGNAGSDGSGAYSFVNGTNGYDLKNQNRILRGDGTYDQGGLRSTEFQLKFNF